MQTKQFPGSPSLSVQQGHLYVEGCDTVQLAEQFSTPLFVLSERHIRENLRRFHSAFASHWHHGEVMIMPAFKACPLLAVRRLLSEEGCGCDVFGPGELEGAVRGAVKPENISVNGSIKDATIIHRAIKLGARIVLDSPRELQLCIEQAKALAKPARVLLRIKPFMAELDTSSDFVPDMQIREMTQMIKYGIPTSELLTMLPQIKGCPHIELLGVHVHMGRHSKKAEVWQAWVQHCIELLKIICESLPDWQPTVIDLGGGFANEQDKDTDVVYKDYSAPSLEDLAKLICETLEQSLLDNEISASGICLEVEPGRGLHSNTGIHLSTIQNCKKEDLHRPRRWAEMDTSEVFLGVPGLNMSPPFDYVYANKVDEKNSQRLDLVGQTCNAELLFHQVEAPELVEGDVIALLNTGAYIEPMSANFNALPRPGTVLVSGNTAEIIKNHETVAQVFARDVIPQRFEDEIIQGVVDD